jgi:ACS family tartrate transporter-like MFS transporter
MDTEGVMHNSSDDTAGARKSDGAVLNAGQERELLSKITWRLLPLLFFCYIIAYLDRINVGFAKLQLREVFGVAENKWSDAFGFGGGLFFIGYFIFEVPSNLILHRIGARIWIARIMIVWGVISAAMMFMRSLTVFYVMRFMLGAAEAGFFPGVILYLTYWYPAKERARIVALFSIAGVTAGLVGSPISGNILELDGICGLAGWQWLFLMEGIPAILMGLVVLIMLPNRPGQARWLTDGERTWIGSRLAEDAARSDARGHDRLIDAVTNSRVWLLILIYFLLNVGTYGFDLWLPSIVKGLFVASNGKVGWINAIPYLVAAIAMLPVGWHSDRTGERRWHVAIAAATSAVGFALAGCLGNPYLAMAALAVAFAGLKCTIGPFWALGTAFLSGTAAAGGIALINSTGNLGGFAGPYIVGKIKAWTGSDVYGLYVLGGALLFMGVLALVVPKGKTADSR